MKRLSLLISFVFLLSVTFSCHRDDVRPDQGLVTMRVAATTQNCMAPYARKYLQVKPDGSTNWQLFSDSIDGFTYEEGYEYALQVRREPVKNPPADGSSIKYILVNQVSKIKR